MQEGVHIEGKVEITGRCSADKLCATILGLSLPDAAQWTAEIGTGKIVLTTSFSK